MAQGRLQCDLTRGDLRQDLQNLDVPAAPVPRQVISNAEGAGYPPVRVTHREPGPRDHARRPGRAVAVHPQVQPRAAED
jgi:hypothetical protein